MLDSGLADEFGALFGDLTNQTLGVAISGGSDSTALLLLAQNWAQARGVHVVAATVDHGLRPEAAAEAVQVAGLCDRLGVAHDVLEWTGWDGVGNVQAMARQARYSLLSEWAKNQNVDCVLLGHTKDDLAENFLIRLSRRSGVDGLAAMDPVILRNGQMFARPMLGMSRDDLRVYLKAQQTPWIDDPSNDDPAYDRVRARRALKVLADLGIDSSGLAQVSQNMTSAKEALQDQVSAVAWTQVKQDRGDLLIDIDALIDSPAEISRRLLGAGLQWVSGADYAPRRAPLLELLKQLPSGKTGNLMGCLVTVSQGRVRVAREEAAVATSRSQTPVWDGRWRVCGPWQEGMQVRALRSQGLLQVPEWRDIGLPRTSLLSSPSVWYDDTLIAAPLADYGSGWSANLLTERAIFLP